MSGMIRATGCSLGAAIREETKAEACLRLLWGRAGGDATSLGFFRARFKIPGVAQIGAAEPRRARDSYEEGQAMRRGGQTGNWGAVRMWGDPRSP